MKSKLFKLGISAACLMIVFAACSKDKKTNPVKTEGSYQDPQYTAALALTQQFGDSMAVAAKSGYELMSFDTTTVGKAAGDSGWIHFDLSSWWWEVYLHKDDTSYTATYRDSIRFEMGDSFQVWPESTTTTGIERKGNLEFVLTGDSSEIAGQIRETFHITGIQSPQIVFNGSSLRDLLLAGRADTADQIFDGAITNVTFNRTDLENEPNPHPIDGAISLAMALTTASPNGHSNVGWQATITFYVDHYHVHLESDTNYWDWDGPYGG